LKGRELIEKNREKKKTGPTKYPKNDVNLRDEEVQGTGGGPQVRVGIRESTRKKQSTDPTGPVTVGSIWGKESHNRGKNGS